MTLLNEWSAALKALIVRCNRVEENNMRRRVVFDAVNGMAAAFHVTAKDFGPFERTITPWLRFWELT